MRLTDYNVPSNEQQEFETCTCILVCQLASTLTEGECAAAASGLGGVLDICEVAPAPDAEVLCD